MGAAMACGLLFALAAAFNPRYLCRYVCPAGLVLEELGKVGLRRSGWWRRCPLLGKYIAGLTFAGALIGYPVFLWLDPFSIFSSMLSIRTAATVVSGVLSGFTLLVLLVLSVSSGSLWCSRLCPLGGMQDLLALLGSTFWKSRAPKPAGSWPRIVMARRIFLGIAAGMGLGFFAGKLSASRGDNAPLRPPGAVREGKFTGLCLRCGNCIRSCPSRIIQPNFELAGITGLFAPEICYRTKYCLEDCCACTRVCPSGAIQPLELEQKKRYVIGEALVDGSLCLLALNRKDCDVCERACPFDAVHTQWDEDRYIAYPVVQTDKCNGCGACEVACPTDPTKAIRVWKRID